MKSCFVIVELNADVGIMSQTSARRSDGHNCSRLEVRRRRDLKGKDLSGANTYSWKSIGLYVQTADSYYRRYSWDEACTLLLIGYWLSYEKMPVYLKRSRSKHFKLLYYSELKWANEISYILCKEFNKNLITICVMWWENFSQMEAKIVL